MKNVFVEQTERQPRKKYQMLVSGYSVKLPGGRRGLVYKTSQQAPR